MSKLIYSAIASLDGYIEDETGKFGWAAPDEELHLSVNELERPIGTCLYGRRMYETLVYWETNGSGPEHSAAIRDWAKIWRAADKIVYSRTLDQVSSARTRLEHEFDPEQIRQLKRDCERDLSVGGSELAARAFADGLIDECHLMLHPVTVGAGKAALPTDIQVQLELLDQRRLGSGVVYLHYSVKA